MEEIVGTNKSGFASITKFPVELLFVSRGVWISGKNKNESEYEAGRRRVLRDSILTKTVYFI